MISTCRTHTTDSRRDEWLPEATYSIKAVEAFACEHQRIGHVGVSRYISYQSFYTLQSGLDTDRLREWITVYQSAPHVSIGFEFRIENGKYRARRYLTFFKKCSGCGLAAGYKRFPEPVIRQIPVLNDLLEREVASGEPHVERNAKRSRKN